MDDNKINLVELNEVFTDLIYAAKPEALETEMTMNQSAIQDLKEDGLDFNSGSKSRQKRHK